MKKKFWIFILCLAILLVIIAAITTNSSRQETGITALYSEETGQITVYAARSSNKHEHYEYRTEGKEIVALSSHYVEDGTDVFVFDIIDNGT
ncbi:MAG: hypothetical protein JG770_2033 [Mahella sp.]|nr:hypothetical protein [Mahella sp.]